MKKLYSQNEEILKEARAERDKILKEARDLKNKAIEEAKEQAKTEAESIIAAAKAAIDNEKRSAINDRITSYNVCYTKLLRGKQTDSARCAASAGRRGWSVRTSVLRTQRHPRAPQHRAAAKAPRVPAQTPLRRRSARNRCAA